MARKRLFFAASFAFTGLGYPVLAMGNPQITFFGDYHEVKRDPQFPSASKSQLLEREERLRRGPVKRLYHQTSPEAANAIMASGKMKRGSSGLAGGGIYFANSPAHTNHKALAKGVVLECEVKLGDIHTTMRDGDRTITFLKLLNMEPPKDSVLIPRKNGIEFVVYNTDQIRVVRVVKDHQSWWHRLF